MTVQLGNQKETKLPVCVFFVYSMFVTSKCAQMCKLQPLQTHHRVLCEDGIEAGALWILQTAVLRTGY